MSKPDCEEGAHAVEATGFLKKAVTQGRVNEDMLGPIICPSEQALR
jgi:hypothetical protein